MPADVPLPIVTLTVRGHVTAAGTVAVTVTQVSSAASPTLDGLAERVTEAWSSSASFSSVSVTAMLALRPHTVIVSSPSTRVSCVGVKVNVPLPVVSFAAIVIVKSATFA